MLSLKGGPASFFASDCGMPAAGRRRRIAANAAKLALVRTRSGYFVLPIMRSFPRVVDACSGIVSLLRILRRRRGCALDGAFSPTLRPYLVRIVAPALSGEGLPMVSGSESAPAGASAGWPFVGSGRRR